MNSYGKGIMSPEQYRYHLSYAIARLQQGDRFARAEALCMFASIYTSGQIWRTDLLGLFEQLRISSEMCALLTVSH